jgi:fatty acid desaturase
METSTTPRTLEEIKRETLVNSAGVAFRDFKKTLTPKFHLVWLHLLVGYLALVAIAAVAIALDLYFPKFLPLTVVGCGLLFGYCLSYILLFFHEAYHYNIAKDREVNDKLANLLIGSLVGQDIKTYRQIHLAHHRYLGTADDPEHSYFNALTLRFILESLTGIRVFKALLGREKFIQSKQSPNLPASKSVISTQFVLGVAINGLIIIISGGLGYWSLAGAWILGMLIFFPFFSSVRNVLEHRDEFAGSEVNYYSTPRIPVNRMFGDGLFASTFGGAGFNRHMLHHWEQQISYTRLKDLETFLLDTEAADLIKTNSSGYLQTFGRLFSLKS